MTFIQNEIPTPKIPTPKVDWDMMRNLPIDELINRMISGMVTLVIHLAIAILVFYIGRFIINRIYKLTKGILSRQKVDASLSTFVLSLIRMLLFFILIVVVIGIIGIETSSFIAIFASAGVAIGMALSGTLQNFAGGVLILLLKPYKVGDYIEAQGYAGTVREIQIFHTIISTPDNKQIIIPNGALSTGSVNNYSRADYRRVDWSISISYGDDVNAARKAILAMIDSDERIVKGTLKDDRSKTDCSPKVFVDQLADSAVVLKVRAWTPNADYWSVYYSINERIYNELPHAGIHFPFPQLDVHLNQVDSAAKE